jgi:hypothetical protein
MPRTAIVTPWVGATGNTPETGARPKLINDYPSIECEDITGQPGATIVPQPNECTVLVVCDAATLAAIQSDAEYDVLWWEEISGPQAR